MKKEFEPQTITVFREGYPLRRFLQDISAGIITGIIALPLAIAFGIASGVTPQQGLYTAIVAGFLISLLSGSRYQIGGPTGAFIIVVYNIIQQHGMNGLAIATVMAGLLLVLMGVLRFGSVIKFIPYPVTIGFTSGIALIIAITQIKDFLGLQVKEVPAEFMGKVSTLAGNLGGTNIWAASFGVGALIFILVLPRITTRVPGSILAIVLSALAVKFFNIPIETVGSRFGEISGGLPQLVLPDFSHMDKVGLLFPAAITIAMLGAIESLLSAVVADGMTGGKHRSNMELVAQGVANIATPFFGGIPATGAIARTAANIKNGGKTPVAGIIHAGVLLLILAVLGPMASMIPLAVLAAILLNVAYRMSELPLVVKMFRAPKSDIAVMGSTFLLTVLLDLTVAIPTGMVLAAFLFMRRMEQVTNVKTLDSSEQADADDERNDPFALSKFEVPARVAVFEVNGPFFFGAASKLQEGISGSKPDVLILRLRNVPAMDATGVFALESIIRQYHKHNRDVLLSGVHVQPMMVLQRAGVIKLVGSDHLHNNIAEALEHAGRIVESESFPLQEQ